VTGIVTTEGEVIEGLVLCRVGVDRLAIRAHEITAFDIAPAGARYAGAGFSAGATAPADAKLLRHHDAGLVVDSVEVHPERLKLLAVPTVLRADSKKAWGGALAGFVEAGGLLWPVLSLARLAAIAEVAR
jgi:hypothetical protein